MQITLQEDDFDSEAAKESISRITEENELLSLATVDQTASSPRAHIATAFYAADSQFRYYIVTSPESEHGQHFKQNDSVALSIYKDAQGQLDEKSGLQVFGTVRQLDPHSDVGHKALDLYTDAFPEWEEFASSPADIDDLESEFYEIVPHRIKIFDETKFGTEVWINAELDFQE